MKTRNFFVLALTFLIFQQVIAMVCNSHSRTSVASNKGIVQKKNAEILKFSKALTYQYEINQTGQKEELWFYVNQKTNQILFVPNDGDVKSIISYPNGKYEIYTQDKNGKKSKTIKWLKFVNPLAKNVKILVKTNQKITIDQQNVQEKNIVCKGYRIDYLKQNESEIVYATEQLTINSHQIYGFSKLSDFIKMPFNIDYSGFFKKHQLVTHIDQSFVNVQLLNYASNVYEFDSSGFTK
jgi:hypothetical protein